MSENKAGLIISFVSLACVIGGVIFMGVIYNKQRFIQSYLTSTNIPVNSVSNITWLTDTVRDLKNTVSNIVKQLPLNQNNNLATKSEGIKPPEFTFEERDLLDQLAQEQLKKQTTSVVNGALRMKLEPSRIFSLDIPASVYKDFSDLTYTFHQDSDPQEYFQNDFSFQNSLHETLSVHTEADDGSLSQISLFSDYGINCALNYSEDIQVASTIFKRYLVSTKNEDRERLKNMDFCKYITVHKNIRSALQDTNKNNLLSPTFPKSSSTTINWVGYTFDMDAFLHDKYIDEIAFFFPADRLFAAVGSWKDQDGAPRIFYRLANVNWTSNPISDYDFRTEPKEFQKRVLNQLDSTIQSIANTIIVLPYCDDFFGRCIY